jgi:hypothetical protein
MAEGGATPPEADNDFEIADALRRSSKRTRSSMPISRVSACPTRSPQSMAD